MAAVTSYQIQEGGIGMQFTKDVFNGLFFIDFTPAPGTQAADFGLDVGDCILGLNSRRFTVNDELADVAALLRSTPRPMTLTVRKAERRGRGAERQASHGRGGEGTPRESSRGSSRGSLRGSSRDSRDSPSPAASPRDARRGQRRDSGSRDKEQQPRRRSSSRGSSEDPKSDDDSRPSSPKSGAKPRRSSGSKGRRDKSEEAGGFAPGPIPGTDTARRSDRGLEAPGEAWGNNEFDTKAKPALSGPDAKAASKKGGWSFGSKVAERFSRQKKMGPEETGIGSGGEETPVQAKRRPSLLQMFTGGGGGGARPGPGQEVSGAGAWNRAEAARLAAGPSIASKRRDSSMRDSYGFRASVTDEPTSSGSPAALQGTEAPPASPKKVDTSDPIATQRAARRLSHQQQLVRSEASKQHLPWAASLFSEEKDRAAQEKLRSALREHREGKAAAGGGNSGGSAAGVEAPAQPARARLDAEEEAVLNRIKQSRRGNNGSGSASGSAGDVGWESAAKGRTASMTAAQLQAMRSDASDGFDKALLEDMAARRRAAEKQEKRRQMRASQAMRADRSALGLGSDAGSGGGGRNGGRGSNGGSSGPDDFDQGNGWERGPWAAGDAKADPSGLRSMMPWSKSSSSQSAQKKASSSASSKAGRAAAAQAAAEANRATHEEVAAMVVVDDSLDVEKAYAASMAKAQAARERLEARRQGGIPHGQEQQMERQAAVKLLGGSGGPRHGAKASRPSLPSAAMQQLHDDLTARDIEKTRRRAAKAAAAQQAAEAEADRSFSRPAAGPRAVSDNRPKSASGDVARDAESSPRHAEGSRPRGSRGDGSGGREGGRSHGRSASQSAPRKGRSEDRSTGGSTDRRRAQSGGASSRQRGGGGYEDGSPSDRGAPAARGGSSRSSSRDHDASGGKSRKGTKQAEASRGKEREYSFARSGLRDDTYAKRASGLSELPSSDDDEDDHGAAFEKLYPRRERVVEKPLSHQVATVADSILDFFS